MADIVQPKKTFQRNRRGCSLQQNVWWHIDQWRTTFGNKRRCEFCPGAINQIKRTALRVENSRRTLHNQAMQIGRANRFTERFAEAVEKIENERFFDLNFFLRPFQPSNGVPLPQQCKDPQRKQLMSSQKRTVGERVTNYFPAVV